VADSVLKGRYAEGSEKLVSTCTEVAGRAFRLHSDRRVGDGSGWGTHADCVGIFEAIKLFSVLSVGRMEGEKERSPSLR